MTLSVYILKMVAQKGQCIESLMESRFRLEWKMIVGIITTTMVFKSVVAIVREMQI